ncbi:glyoxalase [Xylophilus sp. Kf1]|nr:glyoxalase [Xylophilus sp. Kf1]
MTPVSALAEVARPVRDLDRARRFYAEALGFDDSPRPRPHDAALAAWLGRAWGLAGPPPVLRLRLGAQSLLLLGCGSAPAAPDDGGDDTRFQHIAVVTHDMPAAWQRVAGRAPAIGHDGPQRLPAGSGGVTAVKFRDPDGHPVELLAFPHGAVPARWASGATGIDHSAISVRDADRSIDFYRRMGLSPTARQTNRGAEQARLDGLAVPVDEVVVEVVALAPPRPSPHLELLAYRSVRPLRDPPAGPRTTTVWSAGRAAPCLLTDPDGHTHLLLPSEP